MSVVDFISVQECLSMANSDYQGLPKWILEEYYEGKIIFWAHHISYRDIGDVRSCAYFGQYLVLYEDRVISVEDETLFLKIR
jgi:hypothetical protein